MALVYRGRVTKQVLKKLISYLQIDMDTFPEPKSAKMLPPKEESV